MEAAARGTSRSAAPPAPTWPKPPQAGRPAYPASRGWRARSRPPQGPVDRDGAGGVAVIGGASRLGAQLRAPRRTARRRPGTTTSVAAVARYCPRSRSSSTAARERAGRRRRSYHGNAVEATRAAAAWCTSRAPTTTSTRLTWRPRRRAWSFPAVGHRRAGTGGRRRTACASSEGPLRAARRPAARGLGRGRQRARDLQRPRRINSSNVIFGGALSSPGLRRGRREGMHYGTQEPYVMALNIASGIL